MSGTQLRTRRAGRAQRHRSDDARVAGKARAPWDAEGRNGPAPPHVSPKNEKDGGRPYGSTDA